MTRWALPLLAGLWDGAAAAQAPPATDEFLAYALSMLTQRPVGPDVWRPVGR